MSTATMKGVGPKTTAPKRGKKKTKGSTSGPPPATMGSSPGVAGYPGAASMGGSAPGTPVRYPSPFQSSDPSMYNPSGGPGGAAGVNPMSGPPQPTGSGGPTVGTTGVPTNVGAGGSYPPVSQSPTSWYQGQQPMAAGGPQQTPLYSNTPYPRMPYMAQGVPPSESLVDGNWKVRFREKIETVYRNCKTVEVCAHQPSFCYRSSVEIGRSRDAEFTQSTSRISTRWSSSTQCHRHHAKHADHENAANADATNVRAGWTPRTRRRHGWRSGWSRWRHVWKSTDASATTADDDATATTTTAANGDGWFLSGSEQRGWYAGRFGISDAGGIHGSHSVDYRPQRHQHGTQQLRPRNHGAAWTAGDDGQPDGKSAGRSICQLRRTAADGTGRRQCWRVRRGWRSCRKWRNDRSIGQ